MGGNTELAQTTGRHGAASRDDERVKHRPEEDAELTRKLSMIRHKILVLSGKGGVGKSSVAAGLAVYLARTDKKVAVLDIDIHGPSIPRLLGVEGERVVGTKDSISPVVSPSGVSVMSMGLLLRGRDDAVIWRGPLKYSVIKQFLRDVEWGELDYLIVDSPPGTGDEPLSVAQLIGGADGALVVTTPQVVSTNDVRRSIGFSRQLELPILGVIENMSGFVCPQCRTKVDIFGAGGGAAMAGELDVPFLGNVPIDPGFVAACDAGSLDSFLAGGSPGARAFASAAKEVVERINSSARVEAAASDNREENSGVATQDREENGGRKIAVPVSGGKLSAHFGHCEQFVIFAARGGPGKAEVEAVGALEAPPHKPGLLPAWLNERGVDVVIAGGMGSRAQGLFSQAGIEVVVGASGDDPRNIAQSYVNGTLEAGENACDH
jgi:Mrp family chromosome partitioning ATPase/predicted Fe-Mo cluster-binding NifX family protein